MGLFTKRQKGQGTVLDKTDMYGVWFEMIVEMDSGARERVKLSRKDESMIAAGDTISLNYQPGKKNGKAKDVKRL